MLDISRFYRGIAMWSVLEKSPSVFLPRLGSRVRIPSPAPKTAVKSVDYGRPRERPPSIFGPGYNRATTLFTKRLGLGFPCPPQNVKFGLTTRVV